MFLAIHVPDFSVEAAARHRPELRKSAVAIVDGKPPIWTVVGLNAAARIAGIESGMTKLQVEQLFDAVVRHRSSEEEASAHAALLDCAGSFSPRVEDTDTSTVVADIEGIGQLFGSSAEIAQNVAARVWDLGMNSNVAVASNPDAAVCAACGFSGITVINKGTEADRLKPLDVATLPLSEEEHATLVRWGIRTFGALARLPSKALSERLGQKGVHLHRLARGAASRPLVPRRESLHFEESTELDYSITLLEPLAFILNRMCDSLFKRLQNRGLAALELHLTLGCERPYAAHTVSLRMPVPARSPQVATRLLMLELESHPPGVPVWKIHLQAIPSKPRVIQSGLFTPLFPEPEKLELTMARIEAIVGRGNIGSPRLKDTWERDRFDLEHFTDARLRMTNVESREHHSVALRRFRPPVEVSVRLRNQAPTWVAFSGMHGPVDSARGPWINCGNWWTDSWAREEWDVAIHPSVNSRFELGHSQCLLRLFRDTQTNRWYAEGVYD